MDNRKLAQAMGRLDANVGRLIAGQGQSKAEIRAGRKETTGRLNRLYRKFDKLIYGGIAIGVSLIALLVTRAIAG